MKLALGTVQFGLRYGVANTSGQPAEAEVAEILRHAAGVGVEVLDTACLYGDSEVVLGRCLPTGHGLRIVTKTPKFSGIDGASAAASLKASFAESCERLRLPRLYGLLAHDAKDLLGIAGEAIWQTMEELRAEQRVVRVGASVYNGAQIDALLQRYPIDLVQLPLSVLDQRLIQSGHLDRLAERNIEVHVRSVFLQGALLMSPDRLPPHLAGLRPCLEQISERAAVLGISPLQAALRFVSGLKQVAAVVCGVDSLAQFDQLAAAMEHPEVALSIEDAAACACNDIQLLDPSQWRSA
ncbi:MAG: aldo/keto reductase [Sulfuritalea sp.]|nr:aldo/keto reductase [Sulfuritalea sp.]